jgi:1-deoxy-D-xylulose-5-phosphate synthase
MIPGMVIMAPKDEAELRNMLYTAIQYKEGPIAIRYPRGSAFGVPLKEGFELMEIGKAEQLIDGDCVALLAIGSMVDYAMKAAERLKQGGISCEVINMRFAKPLDTNLLDRIAKKHSKVITLEESTVVGGFGSGVLEYFAEKNYKCDVLRIGLPDNFVDHGTQAELHHLLGIDPEGIADKVKMFYKSNSVNQKIEI